jgi:hypothetical protein
LNVKGENISERLLDFAVRALRVVQALPKGIVGRHIGAQLLRCGTSAGSNYEKRPGAAKAEQILSTSWALAGRKRVNPDIGFALSIVHSF